MSAVDGNLHPIGAPTSKFAQAFQYFESTARDHIGPDVNNLVFYIDEDIPCTPVQEEPRKESCCGRRF